MSKRAVIYVFSGTGNTKKAAELFADRFRERGVETEIYRIKAQPENIPQPDDYDYMGIAYPIHAFNAPEPVLTLAKALPEAHGRKYFIVKTAGEPVRLNDASSNKLRDIMSRKGYGLAGEYRYAMPYNMIFRHSGETVGKMWRALKGLAPINADEVLDGDGRIPAPVRMSKPVTALFRVEHKFAGVNGRIFKADADKCVGCGLCEKICPANNIKTDGGKVVFGGDCVLCGGCYFSCPKNAISIGLLNAWKVNGAYDFEGADASDKEKHSKYCKKAYERYFADAEEKIVANREECGKIISKLEGE